MRESGLSLQTLAISALAASAAFVLVPLVWEPGTVFATAMTPVIVALVSEAIRHPVERVKTVRRDPRRQTVDEAPDDPFGLRRPEQRRPGWVKWGVLTGLVAFLVTAAVITASELTIFDGSVSGERGNTTIFGGGRDRDRAEERDRAQPAGDEEATPDAAERETAPAEPTEEPEPTATVAPTVTPEATPAPTTAP